MTSERHTYVVITIPAINPWVTELETNKYKLGTNSMELGTPSTSQMKRSFDDEMDTDELPVNHEESRKKHCNKAETPNFSSTSISQEYLLNFPIPDHYGKVCHLKVYKNSELLKLNSVCEFVGFLSMEAIASNEDDLMNESEFLVHNPPPFLIPRIHCVAFKPLSHNNPLITNEGIPIEKMRSIHKELRILLTQLLLGDELAADYTMYNLISGV